MRVLFLTPGSPDTEKIVGSFPASLGDRVVSDYSRIPVDASTGQGFDVVVYVGAAPHPDRPWVPATETLAQLNRRVPAIHVCSDAGDSPWWPFLDEYRRANAFRVQVGIDGCHDSPLASYGKIALTPVDPDLFPDVPWNERPYLLGFAGDKGMRADLLDYLVNEGVLTWLSDYGRLRYEYVCQFYGLCRYVVNDARTGSGQRHVKGRVVEAALAGAVVVEAHDAPTRDWFAPDADYLTWRVGDDVVRHVRAESRRREHENAARRMRSRALERHAARVFWRDVLGAVGL